MNIKINWSKVSNWLIGASITILALGLGQMLFGVPSLSAVLLIYFGIVMGVLGVIDVDDDPDSS
ncbi:hypothetical protein [Marinobacter sp.]|jgi:putative effector of murein hydrolase|uniref:hypothetical protein n=1 Tax=Marinobacter sp. TaxID=50741 RepID=UPI00260C0B13|nr:hypothetical protein [Marinobacter sp.]